MDNKDQFKGKVKQAVGDFTGNEYLKKEGKGTSKCNGAVMTFRCVSTHLSSSSSSALMPPSGR